MRFVVQAILTVGIAAVAVAVRPECSDAQERAQAPSASTPENLRGYRDRDGETLSFEVVGRNDGTIYGTDIYSDDSHLATAAVHAGVLQVGERAIVNVKILPDQGRYSGSTRHGVTSRDYGAWITSYQFVSKKMASPESPPASAKSGTSAALADPGNLREYRDRVGQTLAFEVVGTTHGSVWGTDTYIDYSELAAAAVHAGVLQAGERGIVKVKIQPDQGSYVGSTRNGVTSRDHGDWYTSYQFLPRETPLPKPPPRDAAQKPSVEELSTPYDLRDYRERVGEVFAFDVRGTTYGTVVGTDTYADVSHLATAAVHAGALKAGQRGIVRVKVLSGDNRYTGSTRNGVTSTDASSAITGYQFLPTEALPPRASASAPLSLRRVVVWPVAVFKDAEGRSQGSCHPLTITVGGEAPGVVRVGFLESEVGGAGPQWRAAGWTASLTAAELTDFAPMTMQTMFNIRGHIDGPSAGALMTIGVLAASRGDTLRPDATMTGTINPDGMIGPVGGIAHKIDGAAKAGKKLMVIPAGIASQRDENTGQPDDLVDRGRRAGVKVVHALDIYTAYRLLTEAELPRGAQVEVKKASETDSIAIESTTVKWTVRWLEGTRSVPEKDISPEASRLFEQAQTLVRHGRQLEAEGELAARMHDNFQGVLCYSMAMALVKCQSLNREEGLERVVAHVRDDAWLTAEVEKAAKACQESVPENIEQITIYLQALDAFLMGISCREVAAQIAANLPVASAAARYEAACTAAVFQARARAYLLLAGDYAESVKWYRRGLAISEGAPLVELADFYGRAGEANVAVFESLIVGPHAEALKVSADEVRNTFMLRDEEFAVLQPASAARDRAIDQYFPPGKVRLYARLADGLFTYCRATMLVAKYYSLNAKLDSKMQIVSVERERTFYDWLDASEQATERNIARARALGIEATSSRLLHEIAHVIRGRELPSRLEALSLLFRANIEARILLRVSGIRQP